MRYAAIRVLVVGAAIALGACATPVPPPKLYALEAAPPRAAATPGFSGAVAIGPTSIAELIDRSQIVQRPAPNRIEVLDGHRWAEPLRSAVPRVLAADLAARLGEPRVVVESHLLARPDYRVALDVARFEYGPGAVAHLELQWSVRRTADGVQRGGRSSEREPLGAAGVEAFVAAQGRALARVATEIAAALRALDAR